MAQPNIKMVVGCYAALVGPGMRCGSGMDCGGAEEEAVDKLLSPLRVCPKTSGGITKFSEHEAD
jgi:hypothetical protein